MRAPLRLAVAALATLAVTTTAVALRTETPVTPPTVTVYKSPTCGCCSRWIDHLRAHGFQVEAHDVDDLSEVKADLGVADELQSCHTAVVDGYVIEGHVPADLITRLLEERPQVAGLAVPGMPMGSPGMEGSRKDPYEVLAFDSQGRVHVYAER